MRPDGCGAWPIMDSGEDIATIGKTLESASDLRFMTFSQCMSATFPESVLRKLAALLAPMDGRPLNTAAIARMIGMSRPSAVSRVLALQSCGRLCLLPRLGENARPLLYLFDGCNAGPASFRTFGLEAVSRALYGIDPDFQYYWWKTGRIRRIDLLAMGGDKKLGFCFFSSELCPRRQWLPLVIGRERGLIQRGFLLHGGNRAFGLSRSIQALPLREFIREPAEWVCGRQKSRQASEAMMRINGKR